jgi:hypothetical protein
MTRFSRKREYLGIGKLEQIGVPENRVGCQNRECKSKYKKGRREGLGHI